MIPQTLIDAICRDPACEYAAGRTIDSLTSRLVPNDWLSLSDSCHQLGLFTKALEGVIPTNAWEIQLDEPPVRLAECVYAIHEPQLEGFYRNCYIFAVSAFDGADMIAIDCNDLANGERLFFACGHAALGYGPPMVATSIADWLQRTFEAGPDSKYYFLNPGFVDLGPAIPNDPEYDGIKGYFKRI